MGKLIWKACQRNCSWSKHLHLFCWFNNQDIHLLNIINSNWINAKYHQMVWVLKRIVFKSHLFSAMSWKSTFEPRSYCAPYLEIHKSSIQLGMPTYNTIILNDVFWLRLLFKFLITQWNIFFCRKDYESLQSSCDVF